MTGGLWRIGLAVAVVGGGAPAGRSSGGGSGGARPRLLVGGRWREGWPETAVGGGNPDALAVSQSAGRGWRLAAAAGSGAGGRQPSIAGVRSGGGMLPSLSDGTGCCGAWGAIFIAVCVDSVPTDLFTQLSGPMVTYFL